MGNAWRWSWSYNGWIVVSYWWYESIFVIFIAGLGGFAGDQVYFYIGRFNKSYVHKNLKDKEENLLLHIFITKIWLVIIFIQRYMYGMRTIIPISIGLTRYDAKICIYKFN